MKPTQFDDGFAPDGETHPRYRADIDGLRAIAVASVVFFHAGIAGLPGGFAGVDVFFVISGYLIGGIVQRDVTRGAFSFFSFYTRRAKRILPALMVLALFQCVLALLVLAPSELRHFAKSAATALVGISNVRFWRDTSYFAPDAHLDPFLMTWSLGVEEQFYILLPPLLLLIFRFAPRWTFAIVCAGSLFSLALSILLTPRDPSMAFYLLPTRAWELGLGTLLALWQRDRGSLLRPQTANIVGGAGLVAIVVAFSAFSSGMAYPGWAATLPVFGSAALLAAEGSWVNKRLLATRVMRYVGLLSYSWYLWHWPLMAFARICLGAEPSVAVLSIIAAASFAIAYLSWRFVEKPFRRSHTGSDQRLLMRYGMALAACVAIPCAFAVLKGLPQRLSSKAVSVERTLAEGHGEPCLAGYGDVQPNRSAACVAPTGVPKIALLGDSHAAALGDSLRVIAAQQGLSLTMLTKSSCPSFYRATRQMAKHPAHAQECAEYNRSAIDAVIADPAIKVVVMTGFWSIAFAAEEPGDGYKLVNPTGSFTGSPQELFRLALVDVLSRLTKVGKQVVILGDAPRFSIDPARFIYTEFLPARAAVYRLLGGSAPSGGRFNRDQIIAATGGAEVILESAAHEAPGVQYRSLTEALCDHTSCQVFVGPGQLLFFDGQHLSNRGAARAIEGARLRQLLRGW